MRRIALMAAFSLLTAPVFAGPEILPVKGMRSITCDFATGTITPAGGSTRHGGVCWGAGRMLSGWALDIADGWVLDWGDIDSECRIGGFSFGYSTDVTLPHRLEAYLQFYVEEDGCDTPDPVYLVDFTIVGLPTADPAGQWNGWIITVDLEGSGQEFTIAGPDLDGDGLTDFGYQFAFEAVPTGKRVGPVIGSDPNGPPPPGAEDGWWIYRYDWDEPNCVLTGLVPFPQVYLELLAGFRCPEPGASGAYCTADIDGAADCIVGLADLSVLLANYGATGGATHEMGDVEPDDGDGDVDLQDLAVLLAQYGDDCN